MWNKNAYIFSEKYFRLDLRFLFLLLLSKMHPRLKFVACKYFPNYFITIFLIKWFITIYKLKYNLEKKKILEKYPTVYLKKIQNIF